MSLGNFGGGDGTLSNPFLIEDFDDLQAINKYPSANYILNNNINLSGKTWIPITILSEKQKAFSGVFNGNGKKISNLYYNNNTNSGMFANTNNAIIKNLFVENADILGYQNAAIVVDRAINNITMQNIKITGKVKSGMYPASIISHISGNGIIKLENIVANLDMNCTNYSLGCVYAYNSTFDYPTININNIIINSNVVVKTTGIEESGYITSTIGGKTAKINFDNLYINNSKFTNKLLYLYSKTEDPTLKDSVLKTDEQFKDKNTFSTLDFNNTWYMNKETGYPDLLLFKVKNNKYIIKKNNDYYNTNKQNCNDKNILPIPELSGKQILTKNDYDIYGINDLNELTKTINNIDINGIYKETLNDGTCFEFELNNKNIVKVNYIE